MTHAATSKVANSAQGSSCKLNFVHGSAHPLHQSEREIKREREREREGEREKEKEVNMYFNCLELLFLFLKGMTGALAPFSYLMPVC
jgi:hypothetical protein